MSPLEPSPRLRPIGERDVPLVLALNERHVELLAPLDEQRLTRLRASADRAEVIVVGGVVAGFVVTFGPGSGYDSENYRWFAGRFGDRFYYLDRVVVAEGFRRRGLARMVYDALEEVARPFGRMALEVNVEPPNEGSLAFHRGRGYVEVGRRGEPGHLVALMAKELRPGEE